MKQNIANIQVWIKARYRKSIVETGIKPCLTFVFKKKRHNKNKSISDFRPANGNFVVIPSTTSTDIGDEWSFVLAWGVGSPRQVCPSFQCPSFIDQSSKFFQENKSYPSILKDFFLFRSFHWQSHLGVFLEGYECLPRISTLPIPSRQKPCSP